MNFRRLRQVLHYGWLHSAEIALSEKRGLLSRMRIFADMLYCWRTYRMWTNQYLKEHFHSLPKERRLELGQKYREAGIKRDLWYEDFMENRKFLVKYGDVKYEVGRKRDERMRAYQRRYNAGKNLMVEYDVNISRQHYLEGTISIGDNVLLAKHVLIDYSGGVVLKDNVQLTHSVVIETHAHAQHSDYRRSRSEIFPSDLVVEEGVVIGVGAVILASCNRIGRYARVGAGAVVTKDVPDYAVVLGVPAKVARYQND